MTAVFRVQHGGFLCSAETAAPGFVVGSAVDVSPGTCVAAGPGLEAGAPDLLEIPKIRNCIFSRNKIKILLCILLITFCLFILLISCQLNLKVEKL